MKYHTKWTKLRAAAAEAEGKFQRSQRRPGARRRGYGVKWQAFAKGFIDAWLRDGKGCALCGRPFRHGSRIDVDHIVPLVEAPERIFDPTNLRCLHHWCHSRRTAQDKAAKERGYALGSKADGTPAHPNHPFNRGGPHGRD